MRTSGLGHQIWRGNNNPQKGAALEGLVMPDALLLNHLHLETEPALAPALAIPLSQHPLHSTSACPSEQSLLQTQLHNALLLSHLHL